MNHLIAKRLNNIFKTHFLIPANRLSAKRSFANDLDLNPMEFLEMLFYVEHEFNINIDDQEIPKIRTVQDLVYCVEKYRA